MTIKLLPSLGFALAGLVMLAGCGERDIILPGERLDIRADATQVNEARPIRLPAPQANADWTHRLGGPDHRTRHPALAADPSQIFSVNIGEGDSRRARITADPVVAGGVIYTLDARAQVTATSTAGQILWQASVGPVIDNLSDASGGGIAVSGGRVFVTTGYGELSALDAATGSTIWVQDLDAPGGSAPTVSGDLVYVVARGSTAWAVDVSNGRVRWQLDGTPSVGNFAGGAGAALGGGLAVFPFSSGEVIGAFPEGGLRRWSTIVTGERLGAAAATISDIAGDPVIDGDRVYVGNFSGRVVAMTLGNGERLWTATEGAVSPVWPSGGSVFLVNDLNQLVRLDAGDGSVIWRTEMPVFADERRMRRLHAHYGPVLAGGRLVIASSDGLIRSFDPVSGALIGTTALPGGAASNPAVAGGTLYVVTKEGQLTAFR